MRQGNFIKNEFGIATYESFRPSNLQDIDNTIQFDYALNGIIIDLHELFARIDSMTNYISNVDIFLYTYVLREALESSRIEGTECTMQNLLDINNVESIKNVDDINETISNVRAINFGINLLNELPICTRMYKLIHKELMKNTRGNDKSPGELRTTQNWVGGTNLKNARYIPPNVYDMNLALNYLDQYINDESNIDIFVKTALIHYQFETIHPFLDGNGRLGRILILIFLIKNEIIKKPLIYMSYFLKMNQVEYYDKLMNVRTKGMYEDYIKFFLICLKMTCNSVIDKISSLNELHNKNISLLDKTNREKDTLLLLYNYIEKHPIIDIVNTAKELNLSYNTINTNILKLCRLNILRQNNTNKRNKKFVFEEYMRILGENLE